MLFKSSSRISNESGFTLLEIIAVLVILSILAVVAVPRYFDMQTQARQRAREGAMAEASGRVNGYFGQQVLAGQLPSAIVYNSTTIGSSLGDFALTIDDGGVYSGDTPPDCATADVGLAAPSGCIKLTVQGNAGTAVDDGITLSKMITRPANF